MQHGRKYKNNIILEYIDKINKIYCVANWKKKQLTLV